MLKATIIIPALVAGAILTLGLIEFEPETRLAFTRLRWRLKQAIQDWATEELRERVQGSHLTVVAKA